MISHGLRWLIPLPIREFIALLLLNIFLFVQLIGVVQAFSGADDASSAIDQTYLRASTQPSITPMEDNDADIVDSFLTVLSEIEPGQVTGYSIFQSETFRDTSPDLSGPSSRGPPVA